MGQYKSQYTGPQIDAGINAALNPDLVPTDDSDALITSDAVAKVQQGFAAIETAATSANSYAIGDLLVWGGILYKAKTSITAGDSFVVDTNIEATTIADKLNNIDTEITSDTDTTLTGLLTGNGSKVGTKSLDTSSLTNDADHVPASSVVKSALDAKADKNDLATIHQTSPTCTETNGIAAGVFFYLDNELVVAKTAIANGATFTNGTNYESPTAGGLNALKSASPFVNYSAGTIAYVGPTASPSYTATVDCFVYIYVNAKKENVELGVDGAQIFWIPGSSVYSIDMTQCAYIYLKKGQQITNLRSNTNARVEFYVYALL